MNISIEFLGIAQDAGIPQIGCNCKICNSINEGKRKKEYPVCLGITNKKTGKKFLIEATPDLAIQYNKFLDLDKKEELSGILLSHAHIGHYAGLIFLGREALNTKKLKIFSSQKMGVFLSENAPWSQLVKLENIDIKNFENLKRFELDEGLWVTPIEVKHRNEYADTFGFIIEGEKKVFFLPDIDTWSGFENELKKLFKECDYLIVDATFYTKDEIAIARGRIATEIPHPSIENTMNFVEENKLDASKIIFIHFNHTNMILHNSSIYEDVIRRGFKISEEGMKIEI